MYKVGINFDEISDDLEIAIKVMKECDTRYGELRTVNKKNFVFWTDMEVADFKRRIEAAGIELVAGTSPLFKWYVNQDDPEVVHDSFGFNPCISEKEKRDSIKRAVAIVDELSIPRLRIFSGLGKVDHPGVVFAHDPLLRYALEVADQHNIDLLIENEPPCRIFTREHLRELFSNQKSPRLKLWLDIANMIDVDEAIDETFLRQIANKLVYVHFKDFIKNDDQKRYVPVGEGQIDYPCIFASLHKLGLPDLFFTVETHVKENKVEASRKSLLAIKQLVKNLAET